ncbi:MAG: hydrogenase maturation nickel metallochaperone HypA [Gaiellaceae bacterium]
MHELALAGAIAEIAGDHARGRRVSAVEVKVGYLRQVVPDALTFAFRLVSADTTLEGAELRLEHVPARVECRACTGESAAVDFPFACAHCGSVDVDVVAGDEFSVEALELEEVLVGGR